MLDQASAADLIRTQLFPAMVAERDKLDRIDRWHRWDHDKPHSPSHATREYRELADRSETPWLGLVVTTVAQALYVEGFRAADAVDDAAAWRVWQANGMDGRQIAIHRAALTYGQAFATCVPGRDPVTGEPMPVIRGVSPRNMTAFYLNPAEDEWPAFALRRDPAKIRGADGWVLRLYDDQVVWRFHADAACTAIEYVTPEEHGTGVCPVVRYANQMDLEGRTPGEVEPFIPLAARIDQTVFDRLVVQRFASWVVRTISGMSAPEGMSQSELDAFKLRLKVEDLLIAEDPDSKFGALPASPIDPYINAKEADVRDLAAVSQTPPHHLLGQMANLSAEALAAAEASTNRKVEERKHAFGESHEQLLRLAAWQSGDVDGYRDRSAQVRWRDMESRSLAQVADALGKLAQMLQVPVEMLWERIPGWTSQDVERARQMADEADVMGKMLQELAAAQTSPEGRGINP